MHYNNILCEFLKPVRITIKIKYENITQIIDGFFFIPIAITISLLTVKMYNFYFLYLLIINIQSSHLETKFYLTLIYY